MAKPIKLSEEDAIQADIIDLLKVAAITGLLYFAVPNGGRRAMTTAKTMKATGQKAGITDIILVHPGRGTAFFMEVKTKTGSLFKEQREFRDYCHANNLPWAVVRSRDEAQAVLARWRLITVTEFVRPIYRGAQG